MKKASFPARLTCLALALMLVLSGAAFAYQADPNLNEPGALPLCKETVALSLGHARSTTVIDYNTNYMTEQIQKDGNFTLEFVEMGSNNDEMKQKVELMVMAGGNDLPDVLMYNPGQANVLYYGQLGTFVNLNDYFDNSSYFLKEALKDMTWDPMPYARSADGNLYGLFAMSTAMETAIYLRLYTNTEFLEALGVEMPTSLQEFEDFLRAVKEKDPNGNGQNDEVGFMTSKTRLWNHMVMPLMTPFIYSVGQGGNNYLSFDENGKIQASYATEQWREGLRWIHKLVSEGLISPFSFTQDDEQVKTFANSSSDQLIGVSTYYPVNWYPTGDERAVNWACMPALTGFDGNRVAPYAPEMPAMNFFITKTCENPEAAFRLGDMMMGEKYTLMTRYGEENVDWVHADPSDVSYYEGYDALYVSVLPWSIPQNKRWDNLGAWLRTPTISNGIAVRGKLTGLDAWANEMASSCVQYIDQSKVVSMIIYNQEESDVINEIVSNIETYRNECFSRFAVGDMSLDHDWESYLAEMENMGLSTYLEYAQNAYNRMHGVK